MDMIVIAGFLGSGKTTLVLSAVKDIYERYGKKVAVIVNDFGTIGIDGKVMEKYGLQVKELAAGCICCTLGTNLLVTVKEIYDKMQPDVIIIEPTGIANPESVVALLAQSEEDWAPEKVHSVVIIDAHRFPVLMKAFERPLKAQLANSEFIVINKIDTVDENTLAEIQKTLEAMAPEKEIICASASQNINVAQIVDRLVG
ncbi:GTP-binding protein [Candidatus Methanomassiliicoccus intestinalis]|uniref:GTP-binding protein n=1 Tax=Candidatus Methanomassiliicoccus intestinalis TaxID=1406512 RepID=UPI0037DC85B8